jgi:hypothetical protein
LDSTEQRRGFDRRWLTGGEESDEDEATGVTYVSRYVD